MESDVRRSPRIKIKKNGFKDPICKDKNCLSCNAKPLALSTKAIRKISSTLCDLNASQVTDAALNNKKKKDKATPMGPAPPQER